MGQNVLYYGDNLEVLRRHVKDESVDLVYLDPPFNSNQNYNILFAEHDGARSAAQIRAFEDTWRWDQCAAEAYEQVVESGGRVAEGMRAFRTLLGDSDMMAYLAMMAPRLVELRRVMKQMGSIYLHCGPTASHYLKMPMDTVFSPENFKNEIVWKRTTSHGNVSGAYGYVTDTILFYARSKIPTASRSISHSGFSRDSGSCDSSSAKKTFGRIHRQSESFVRKVDLDQAPKPKLLSDLTCKPSFIPEFMPSNRHSLAKEMTWR